MDQVLLFLKKYHLVRILLNALFLCLMINMAYNNYRNDFTTEIIHNKTFRLHQIIGTVFFYAGMYIILLVFTFRFLFKHQNVRFYLYTLLGLLFVAFCLTLHHFYICKVFGNIEEYLLVPISLGSGLVKNSFSDYFTTIVLKETMFYIMLFLPLLARNYFTERKAKELILQKQNEIELAQLKSQINPHFLFNVLNSIYSLAIKKSDQTPDIVLRLSELLRFMLYESKGEAIPLSKEIKLVMDYIEIEKIRMNNQCKIEVKVEQHCDSVNITPLLLLPFVENAFKHGLDSMISDSSLDLSMSCKDNELKFVCRNTFKQNIADGKQAKVGGIGIENVRKRLLMVYPNRHKLEIYTEKNFFVVNLTVNL